MENPQTENGHIDIANEIAEKLSSFHLSGNEWLILWVILRKTWGWHKKEDAISLTQFEKKTGLSRPSVREALTKLVGKKVLVVGKKVLGTNTYGFNKLYSQWVVGKKVLVGFSVRLVGKKEPILVGKKEHTKENKETITKEILPDKSGIPKKLSEKQLQQQSLIRYCREIQGITHEYVNYVKQTTALSKIFNTDYSEADIRFVIDEMWADPYWHDNTFDMMNVANNMQKYLNRTVYFKKGGKT